MPADGMEGADIREGACVVAARDAEVESGSLAAVATDDEPLVRRLHLEDGAVRLVAEGPEGCDQTMGRDSKKLRILRPVVGIMRQM